ncbi:MAG: hypothetical protein QM478_11660 [Flavobacteriaceae bacterium]
MNQISHKKKIIKNEVPESKHIPALRHVNDNIIKTINGDYFFTLKISGLSYETIDDEDLDIYASDRNKLFKSFEEKNVIFYTHTIRKEISIQESHAKYSEGFAEILDKSYNKNFKAKKYYINELYLTLLIRNKNGILSKYKKDENFDNSEKQIIDELNDYIIELSGAFNDYHIKLLGIRTESGIDFSESSEFLSSIVNLDDFKIRLPEGRLNENISINRKIFGWRNIEVQRSNNSSKYGILLTIKDYSPWTHTGMLDHLSGLDCEFVLTQTWKTVDKQKSIEKISTQERNMNDGDYATGLAAELTDATDKIAGNDITMGDNHFSLFLYANSLKELDLNVGFAQAELRKLGITVRIDKLNTELAFWAQLPGNSSYIARKGLVTSYNFAHLSSFHNLPIGNPDGSKWGEYVSVLATANDTPYYLNWHFGDLGLTTIVGTAGSGKTALTLLLLGQSMKFKANIIAFDKDQGIKLFVKATNGNYSDINYGEKTNWNPLQMNLQNKDNREFLFNLFKVLLRGNREFTAEETTEINSIIETISHDDSSVRKLGDYTSLIYATLPERIYEFTRWVTDDSGTEGEYAWIFDNQEDLMEVKKGRITAFDMTNFLDSPEIRTPILMYLFKQVENSLDGTPTIIFVDECQKATEDETFRKEFENHANTIRKRNGIVIMATQRAKAMNVNESLVEQAPNQIFFGNPKAKKEDYATFALSDRELDIIRDIPQKTGWFLLKRPDGAVILRADLTGCDDELAILSGRKETLNLMDQLIKEHGEDAHDWLPIFFERWRDEVKK